MTSDKRVGQRKENTAAKSVDELLSAELNDQQVIVEIGKIESLLSQGEANHVASDLDKQILAAAYRNLNGSRKNNDFQLSWWRKIALPLYVATGFSLTILAYNNLWPTLPYVAPNGAKSSAAAEISLERTQNNESTPYKADFSSSIYREKIRMPTLLDVSSIPNVIADEPKLVAATPINKSTNEGASEDRDTGEQNEKDYYTGSQLVKAEFREKDSWARTIIDHMRGGQFELAKVELRKFKNAYPDYPIEEQIKSLSQ